MPSNRLACHFHTGQWQTSPFSGNEPPKEHLQPQAMHAWQWRLQDFRQGDRKVLLSLFIFASPFIYLRGALRHTICSFFLFASPPICLRSHAAFRTASACHFRCWGKGNSGIVRGCKVKPPCGCPEKSPPSQVQVVFCPTNLASPNPYLWEAPETKTTDVVGRRHKETTDIRRGEKKKDSTQLSQSERNKLQSKKFKIWKEKDTAKAHLSNASITKWTTSSSIWWKLT